MRTSGCSQQWDVFADYSSAKGMAEQFGPDRCASLAQYDIEPAAIRLLRQEGLCKGRTSAPPASNQTEAQPAGGISWREGGDNVGTTQRVCGPLAGIGRSSDDVFLNVGRDYPDPERFTIVLWDVGGVEPLPTGTNLCASGRITLYQGVAQIELRSIGAVEVYR
jgi:hypothetical protein